MSRKLYRNAINKQIGGVCSGLADYFNLDVAIMRIIMICLVFVDGFGLLLYILMWIILPLNADRQIPAEPVMDENGVECIPAEPVKSAKTNRSLLGGAVLIGLGFIFLIDEWWDFMDSHYFWPAILIVIGLGLIINSKKSGQEENAL